MLTSIATARVLSGFRREAFCGFNGPELLASAGEKTDLNIHTAQEPIKVPLKMRSMSARKDVKVMINSLANAVFWQ